MKAVLLQAVALSALAAMASAQVRAGGEFQVNTNTQNSQRYARAAMEPDGDFVVVWESGIGVFGQRFAASGATHGGEFLINTSTSGPQFTPAVAAGPGGEFTVVWESYTDGSQSGIRGQRYAAGGTAVGGEFQVNTFTTGLQRRPEIGRAADGRSVVSWLSYGVDGSLEGIAARRFDASGDPIGGEFVVNTYTTGDQWLGGIAVEDNGNFVVVWEDGGNRDGSGYAILAQRFDASANRLGAEFVVNSYTPGSQRVPSVSAFPAGGFVVTFSAADGSASGMFARRFDASGNAVGNDFAVNTYTTGNQYGFSSGQVATDRLGNFVITWHGPDDGTTYGPGQNTFAQRFSPSGTRRGVEFGVNTYTTDRQFMPAIASDPVGNVVVVWDSMTQDGSSDGVFAQRFGGLGPAGLTVDTAGNQVLEPGETVDVRPSWRNFNGAPQTFSGTLTNITGPAGASYTITDAAGDYGTVADGTTAQCVDCYAVSVSNPPTRPAVHWDASAVESVLPDIQGQQKQWLLHVGGSFTDVPATNPFYRFVETLLHHAVTAGCFSTGGQPVYCPGMAVSRSEMAVFVLAAKDGPGVPAPCGPVPLFADVPASNTFCRWIEELARRGVVSGCGGGNYCPTSPVTREQMAVFVLRTLDPTLTPQPCATPLYNDVPASSGFCPWIEELTRRAVVTGCGGGNYCPTDPVSREQMAVFISATFGLTLYGP